MSFYYQPGVVDRSGEILAGAINQGGQNAAGTIGDLTQMRKEAKAADAMYDAMEPADGPDGSTAAHPVMAPDRWKSLSWSDKAATMKGFVQSTVLKNAMATQKQERAKAALLQQEADATSGDARLLQALDAQVNVPTDPLTGQPMTSDPPAAALAASLTPIQRAIIHSGAQMGPNQKGSASAIYRQLLPKIMAQGGEGDGTPGAPVMFPIGDDATGVAWPGTKERSIIPKANPEAKTRTVGDGTQQVWNGKTWQKLVTSDELSPKDALGTYNKNQTRVAEIKQQLKLAQNPEYKDSYDAEALNAELDDLKEQQAQLKGVWSKTKPGAAAVNPNAPVNSQIPQDHIKYLQQHPESWQSFEIKYGKGSSSQFLP